MTAWRYDELSFAFDDSGTWHPVVTLHIDTPAGEILAMATPVFEGRSITLHGLHIQSDGIRPNQLGPGKIRTMALALLELLDVDELIVAARVRTTGANPGPSSSRVRIARRDGHPLGRGFG